jgi:hypothetical protein
MALPEMLSFEDLQDMLNVSAPTGASTPPAMPQIEFMGAPTTVGMPSLVDAPTMPLGDILGSQITYIDRPQNITYSPENLPEFMKDFEQISPTLFAPSQGVFGQAPEVDTIQPLMPQQYVDEYADLERAFQESIALDPTMFGGMYRSGIYMPTQTIGDEAPEEGVFDVAGAAAAAQVLSDMFPRIEKPEVDLPEIDLGEPEIDVPSIDVPELDLSFPEIDIPSVDIPSVDIPSVDIPSVDISLPDVPLPEVEVPIPEIDISLPDLSDVLPEIDLPSIDVPSGIGLSDLIPDISLPEIPDVVEESTQAVGEIINLVEDPSVKAAGEAIEQINIAGKEGGLEGDIIAGPTETFVTTTAAGAAISDAIEDPDAANLAQAYEAVDYLTNTYAGKDLLSGGDLAGEFGSILSGIDVLEDGIESPADALAVAKAAQSIGALTGSQATFDVASSVAGFLSPVATIAALGQGVKVISGLLQGGAAGEYPNSYGKVSYDGNSFTSGNYGGGDGASSMWGEAASKSAAKTLNRMKNSYGFSIDSAKVNEVLGSGVGNVSSNPYYNTKANRSNGPQKVVYELLKAGAITPTEATPSKYLESTEAFNKFVESQFDYAQNAQASEMGGSVVPFTSTSAAERFINSHGTKQSKDTYKRSITYGGDIFESFELGEKTDDGRYLDKTVVAVGFESANGIGRFAGQGEQVIYDGKTGKEKSRKMVPTHYMKRDVTAERKKEQFGYYPYDPKFDKDEELYNQYQTYSMESRFGYYGGPPPMMQKQSKTSKFAKDAKLYMPEDHWNMTFA